MARGSLPKLLDITTTLFLFAIGITGLIMALGFPGRSRMWPIYVMSALIITAGIHLCQLFIAIKRSRREALNDGDHQREE